MKDYRRQLADVADRLRRVVSQAIGDKKRSWQCAFILAVECVARARKIDIELSELAPLIETGVSLVLNKDHANAAWLILDEPESKFSLSFPDSLGWLYHFWHDKERKAISERRRACRSDKYTDDEIGIVTQIYTEQYMVAYLLENSLGKLWSRMHPETALTSNMKYYVQRQPQLSKESKPVNQITVLDPSCGCGNFLLGSFDLLLSMYREEGGYSDKEACISILNANLFGIDIDHQAIQVCRTVLWLRAKEVVPSLSVQSLTALSFHVVAAPTVSVEPEAVKLGSLLRSEQKDPLSLLLVQQYDVVTTNPPYMDKRDYPLVLRDYLRNNYAVGAGNLYTAFVLRCLELAKEYVAMVTPQTFLFINSYRNFRQHVLANWTICTLGHLGLGAFAAMVDTAMFVLGKDTGNELGVYIKLTGVPCKEKGLLATISRYNDGLDSSCVYIYSQKSQERSKGSPIIYWLGSGVRTMLAKSKTMSEYADIVLGMKTSDNKRFVRLWWELPEKERWNTSRWMSYEKEVSGYRYKRNSSYLILWNDFARAYYKQHYSAQLPNVKYWLRPGIVYGLISSKCFCAKLLDAEHMTDMAASCIFPHESENTWFLLSLLNSKIYQWLLNAFNPTVNFQPIDVKRLPVPEVNVNDMTTLVEWAKCAAEVSGKLYELEITDRCNPRNPQSFFPFSDKVSERKTSVWSMALKYVLARDAIDLKIQELFCLSEKEVREITEEMGKIPSLYRHDMEGLSEQENEYKSRLKEIYEDGQDNIGATIVSKLDKMTHAVKLPPSVVCQWVQEGIAKHGWRDRNSESQMAQDALTCVILSVMEDRAFIPLTDGCKGNGLVGLVRRMIATWCNIILFEAEFEAIVGISIQEWILKRFFKRHIRQFRKRPIVWQLSSQSEQGMQAFSCLIHSHRLDCLHDLCQCVSDLKACCGEQNEQELQNFIERVQRICGRRVDTRYGIRLSIAPFEQSGLLASPVLGTLDTKKAVEDYDAWQIAQQDIEEFRFKK
ncbi:MAG: uncharacterized protein H6Q75_229 [Firmicutes bacterium]|nr:uncharacterized protein [Bacillota bacterium]